MLCMLLFALWFEDYHASLVKITAGNHASLVKFTAGNHSHMPAKYSFNNPIDFLHAFKQNMYLLLKIYKGLAIFKYLQKVFFKR